MNYPAFDLLHTEDDIKESAIGIIEEYKNSLDDRCEAGEIASCIDAIEAIKADGYINTFMAEFIYDILKSSMTSWIDQSIGELEPRNIEDILIYAEIYRVYVYNR